MADGVRARIFAIDGAPHPPGPAAARRGDLPNVAPVRIIVHGGDAQAHHKISVDENIRVLGRFVVIRSILDFNVAILQNPKVILGAFPGLGDGNRGRDEHTNDKSSKKQTPKY